MKREFKVYDMNNWKDEVAIPRPDAICETEKKRVEGHKKKVRGPGAVA